MPKTKSNKTNAKRKTRKSADSNGSKLVSQPSAKSSVIQRTPAKVIGVRDGLRIKHRELLATPNLGTNFSWKVWNHAINPGLAGTFPWLSGVARNFEQYRINYLSFHYVPLCPTTHHGGIIACVDYDPRDAEYNLGLSRQQMMQNASATSAPVWSHVSLKTNPASLMGGMSRKFVRVFDADPLMSTSVRSSDCGDFIYGISVNYSNVNVEDITYGDWWVEYDITLLNPQPNMTQPAAFQTTDVRSRPVASSMSEMFRPPTDLAVGAYSKRTGGLIGTQGYASTGPNNITAYWFLQDLIPGAYYWITAMVNEAASGVSDTLSFLTTSADYWKNLQIVDNPLNRTTTTAGGGSVAIRALVKALADTATAGITSAYTSGGTGSSTPTGSLFSVTPTPELQNIFAIA